MCRCCGLLGRKDSLATNHFKTCQPKLTKLESGYLKAGEEPELGSEPAEMVLHMVGCTTPM